ncbi:MAG: phosphoenolpyruvate synthase [bacterium]
MFQHILWFDQIRKTDIPVVGGKGANLGELISIGINVPEGFVISAQSFFYFLDKANIREAINSRLLSLDPNDSTSLLHAAQEAKTMIQNAQIPEDIEVEILSSYHKLSSPENRFPAVAVRSSATAEDLPDASFAGQQATFLNVYGDENIIAAVKSCWASLFEARAIFYRVQKHFEHSKVGIAVVVQRMVQSEKSGIMFTVDPISNDPNSLLIEAGYGLGEAVVAGEITPDEYSVNKKTIQISNKVMNQQTWQIVRTENVEIPTELEDLNEKIAIPPHLQEAQKISDKQIIDLAKIGMAIEQHYNYPQDTEWAIENDTIYLVQSRPITTLPKSIFPESSHEIPTEAAPVEKSSSQSQNISSAEIILQGASASPGIASGKVRIITDPKDTSQIQEGDVLVAEMTTPDYVPAMKKSVAIITDSGGRTCHAAIVSRELGIPCIVGSKEATKKLKDGQIVTVNATLGTVYEGNVVDQLKPSSKEQNTAYNAVSSAPIITGTNVYVNLAAPHLAEQVAQKDVDGVGLLRAEFIIANIGEHPRKMLQEGRGQVFIDKLTEGVGSIARAFYPRPVIYRMTDFKTNEYKNLKGGEEFEPHEENPMMGYRGSSRYLRERDLFQLEIEMIKKVHAQNLTNLWIMVPFVRTVNEMREILKVLSSEGLQSSRNFKIWMMAEIPSNVVLIDEFCKLGIDGVSIGSNDLTQLVLGLDRDNETILELFDERDDAVMLCIKKIIESCNKHGITCSICGQAPSVYPEITQKLVEWGITSVSVNPDMIEQTRKFVAKAEQRILLKKTLS